MSKLMRRREAGPPPRCPRCESYRIDEDIQHTDDPEPGFFTSTVCSSCGWRSDREFTSMVEHFRGTDVLGYLSRPAEGPSDRLNRNRKT